MIAFFREVILKNLLGLLWRFFILFGILFRIFFIKVYLLFGYFFGSAGFFAASVK